MIKGMDLFLRAHGATDGDRVIRLGYGRSFAAALLLAAALGCGKEDPKFILEKKPIPGLPYQGFRRDIPAERRGNGIFAKGVFTRDGRYLVTLGPGIKVRGAVTGELLRTLPANLDGNDPLIANGTHHKVLARRGDVAPNSPKAMGLWIVVVLREGRIETWTPDGARRLRSVEPPPGRTFCEQYDPIAHEKFCIELSRSGRWLALIDRDRSNPMAPYWTWLIDLEHGTLRRVTLPDEVDMRAGHGFAFSPTSRPWHSR